jgi:hypothetical protein
VLPHHERQHLALSAVTSKLSFFELLFTDFSPNMPSAASHAAKTRRDISNFLRKAFGAGNIPAKSSLLLL